MKGVIAKGPNVRPEIGELGRNQSARKI